MKAFLIAPMVWVLGGLAPVGATLIYAPFPVPQNVDFQPWDVNGDGAVDFTILQRWVTSGDVPPSSAGYSFEIYPADNSYVLGVGSAASVLSMGAEIQVNPPAPDGWQRPPSGLTGVGSWAADLLEGVWLGWSGPMETVEEGFLGLRFPASDGDHLGWLRVRREEYPDFFDNRIAPIDFVWETGPVTALTAGAVPEPSVFPLLLLGMWLCGTVRGMARRK